MNVGILVSGFPPEVMDGAELQAQQLAGQLVQRGHRVDVFTRTYGSLPGFEEKDGYFIHRRKTLPIYGARMIVDAALGLSDIARQHPRPGVLLCYQIVGSLIGVLAQRFLGIPAIAYVRGNRAYQFHTSTVNRLVNPVVFKYANRIIVQTPRVLQEMKDYLQKDGFAQLAETVLPKTSVIPNGIDLPCRPRSQGTKVMYLGRLIAQKGIADLIQAMKRLPHAELLIVGDGPERARLEAMAGEIRATFVGRVPPHTVVDYLQQARVLVLPAYWGDGLPNVILEAMSCGVPVVATNTAGIPDIVSHGETGYLYEPGDIRQLVIHIGRLLADNGLHRKLSERSLQKVQPYSWDIVAPQVEQLLSKCIS